MVYMVRVLHRGIMIRGFLVFVVVSLCQTRLRNLRHVAAGTLLLLACLLLSSVVVENGMSIVGVGSRGHPDKPALVGRGVGEQFNRQPASATVGMVTDSLHSARGRDCVSLWFVCGPWVCGCHWTNCVCSTFVALAAHSILRMGPTASRPTDYLCLCCCAFVVVVGKQAGCPSERRLRGEEEAWHSPRILLHSYMGSGNTWLRLMLESVTGGVPRILRVCACVHVSM
jgi:hypothetical protein